MKILEGKKVTDDVSLVISPGSSKILSKMAENGALASLINAGARIIENLIVSPGFTSLL